jgi:hypothetical protein
MPIVGAKYWNDKSKFYSQENNPIEEALRKEGETLWLESCGPTAAVNCIASMGLLPSIRMPGGYEPQPEQILFDFFNDPFNYEIFKAVRKDIDPSLFMNNRVPQFYPDAVDLCFGIDSAFQWATPWGTLVDYLTVGKAVQICCKDPGHYMAAVAVDTDRQLLYVNNPWTKQPGNNNSGFNEILTRDRYEKGFQPWSVVYHGKL